MLAGVPRRVGAGRLRMWRRRRRDRSRRANAAPAAAQGLKIAVIAKSSTNPVFLAARTGAEAAAKELSAKHDVPVEIAWLTPPHGRRRRCRRSASSRRSTKARAPILISCSDAGKVTGAINDAVARGVAVMTFDSDAPRVEALRVLRRRRHARPARQVMDELATADGREGQGRDPRRQPERAEPAEARRRA